MKVAAAVHNTIRCYHVISDEKKRATTQTSLGPFFKKVDRIEPSEEPEPVSLTSGLSDTAACPPSPMVLILQLYHLPPPFSPLVSNASCPYPWCQPHMPDAVLYYSTVRWLFKALYCRIENVFFNYIHSFLKMYLQKKMYLHHHGNYDLNALTWLLFEIQSLDPCTVVKLKMWLNTKSRLQNTVPGPFFL